MLNQLSPRQKAALQALLVTFLWSTSTVFIKFGLEDIPALTFAGLRYTLGALCLLPFVRHLRPWQAIRTLPRQHWLQLLLLSFLFYTFTQGSFFLGLTLLPAVTVSLFLSLTPVIVALFSMPLLGERPSARQWLGIFIALFGALFFFYPIAFPTQQLWGIFITLVGLLTNALGAISGRQINRLAFLPPILVTVITMSIGGLSLLIIGIGTTGLPSIDLNGWLLIIWLAAINGAFANTLWNISLQTLTAVESSTIQNSMMVQVPLLAVLFLGEWINGRQLLAMLVAAIGILLVQWQKQARHSKPT